MVNDDRTNYKSAFATTGTIDNLTPPESNVYRIYGNSINIRPEPGSYKCLLERLSTDRLGICVEKIL
jgi:hypothetical protein